MKGVTPRISPMEAVPESSSVVSTSCNDVITLTCLQDLYGIPTTSATQQKNVLSVSGFVNEFVGNADLEVRLWFWDRRRWTTCDSDGNLVIAIFDYISSGRKPMDKLHSNRSWWWSKPSRAIWRWSGSCAFIQSSAVCICCA